MKYSEIKPDQKASLNFTIDESMVRQFVRLTGDVNSVHFGEKAIVHGMLIVSFISTFIGTLLPGDGSVWVSNNTNFVRPIRVGDEIRIVGSVSDRNDRLKRVRLFIDVHNQLGELCIMCTCWVNMTE